MSAPRSFFDVVRGHVERRPERSALIYLDDDGGEAAHWTYADLDRKARAVAACLQAEARPGARALLLFPPGLEFAAALMGCLYAGLVPVPGYPPRKNRTLGRLLAVVRDAGASLALTTATLRGRLVAQARGELGFGAFRFLASDECDPSAADAWREPPEEPSRPAFLQYTSGSTGDPKGVLVSHASLLHNNAAISERFGHGAHTVMCGWLPLFHDMGLVGTLLHPLYLGVHSVLMAPAGFLQQPLRWLAAITRYRATTSGAPNSAYDLCSERIAEEQLARLDLSSWQVAFNGSESIRAATLERFLARFGRCGLARTSLCPCYGMAEATLLISGDRHDAEYRRCEVERDALEQHRAVPPARPGTGVTLVSCGRPASGHRLLIVDPETRRPCADGRVGEIWFAGGSVAGGYWGREKVSAQVFQGHLDGSGEGPFLRTGDLGFVREGELYVTGRVKDLVIIAGRNHYPQDVEQTVAHCHAALQAGCVAAVAVAGPRGEALAVVAELRREALGDLRAEEIVQAVREAVAAEHELELQGLALLRPGHLPKTSSGKIQRHLCRQGFLDGQAQKAVHVWRHPALATDSPRPAEAAPRAVSEAPTATEIRAWLAERVGALAGLPSDAIDPRAPFTRYGLDSRQAVALSGELADWLGRPLPPTLAYDYPTLDAVAEQLAPARAGAGVAAATTTPQAGAIAVIGLSCRFPGAPDLEAFWRLLRDGVEAVGELPRARWDVTDERLGSLRGGFLEQVDLFDAEFFGISPREAELMDPQQRLLLELAWEALEHAQLAPAELAGSRTGVFVGISSQEYVRVLAAAGLDREAHAGTGGALSIAANRLSYVFDLRGPSWAVDTACSSSLVAVHQACRSLLAGECDLALAGGVSLMLTPHLSAIFSQAGMLSPSGRCRTFDAAADGYVRGEGAGLVVLARAADAARDGERVLALVRGSAVNQDGLSNGLTAPSGPSQQAVVREALAQAGLAPRAISYVEAHGTATPLGDPIELNALGAVLSEGRAADEPCFVGSVKTNLGHLEAAAGIAGFIKVVLALGRRAIPAHLHLREPNPRFDPAARLLRVPTRLTAWPSAQGARRAGVSSFGFGGTNAHVVLEQPPDAPTAEPERQAVPAGAALLALSARTLPALRELACGYAERLTAEPGLDLHALCAAAGSRRARFGQRAALLGSTSAEMREGLLALHAGHDAPRVWRGEARAAPRVAFLFTGQGTLEPGAGRELFASEQPFRDALERCDALLRTQLDEPLLEVLYGDRGELLQRDAYAQPALLAFEYALGSLWRAWGVEPLGLLGHGLGEYAAATLAGVFALPAALELVARRGRLTDALPPGGAMLAVQGDVELAAALAADHAPALALGAHDGPRRCVLSGEARAVAAAAARLEAQGCRTRPLIGAHASHSPLVEPMLAEFERALAALTLQPPSLTLISSVTGELAGGELATPAYWARHTLATVRFADALHALVARGCDALVEIGPCPTLLALAREAVPEGEWVGLASLDPPREDRAVLLGGLARLWSAGAGLRFRPGARLELPGYPFQRRRFWPAPLPEAPRAAAGGDASHPLLGRRLVPTGDRPNTSIFEARLDPARLPGVAGHRVGGSEVLPYAAYFELALAAAQAATGRPAREVRGLELHQPVSCSSAASVTLQTVIDVRGDGSLALRVYSRAGSDEASWRLAASASLAPPEPDAGAAA